MTDRKISELTDLTGANAPAGALIPVVDTTDNTTKRMTRTEFFKNVPSVQIGSGTINGTSIGATTASTGAFTSITGTAVTQSPTDTTPGRVMTTGGAGWLLDGAVAELVANMDTWQVSGAFRFGSSTVGRPPGSNAGSFIQVSRLNPDSGPARQFQLAFTTDGRMLHREMVNVGQYAPWKEIFTTANILGTVSQSGGIPTGAIIQRGSNSNGEFVRFADGTQICWRDVTESLSINVGFQGGFRSGGQNSTFPVAFSVAPATSAYILAGTAFGLIAQATPSTASWNWAVTAVTSQSSAERKLQLIAVGRWF